MSPKAGGGVVAAVVKGGPAQRSGIVAGDVIVRADRQRLRDVIDWQWLADGAEIDTKVCSADGVERWVTLKRDLDESWGLAFTDVVFDGVRTCRNRCAFCFMAQLPKGLRPALYVRDDDYRLSFLQGNFVTLTNLSDTDLGRIAEQHLTPLYVSLHAVDPAVRERLICARNDQALERFDELHDAGIELHVQIVLVPEVNDGAVLDESLTWLAEREGVLSVGVVPLGYTSHQDVFTSSFETPDAAAKVIAQIEPWQVAFRERDALTWVYLADEFYLTAGRDVPPAEHYDGYPQYENGIGLVRSFADEIAELAPQIAVATHHLPQGVRVGLVTGRLFAPVLDQLLAPLDPAARLRVLAVDNRFFGGNVSVTGLVTGSDLVSAIAGDAGAAVYLVPAIVANADGLLLDDVPVDELGERSGKDVRLLSCDAGGLLEALRDVAASPPTLKE